jgi:hypothetical protein
MSALARLAVSLLAGYHAGVAIGYAINFHHQRSIRA